MELTLPPEPKIVSLEQFVEETKPYMARPRESRFGRISLTDVAKRKVKGLEYLVEGWMVAQEQSFLGGESQSGKSFLALHLGMCVATGRDFLGRKTQRGLVIYQAGESGTGITDLRIPAWLKQYGEDMDVAMVPFETLTARVSLSQPDGNADQFIEAIKNIADEWKDVYPLRLVVIDTFAKALSGGNENDARDIGRILDRGDRISRETGAHVCFVHHVPKGGTTLRGHGSLKGDTDSVAMVTCDEQKIRTLTFDKVKDGPNGGKLQFELMAVEIGRTEEDKPITSCVIMQVGEKAAAKAAGEKFGYRLNASEIVLFRALLEALKRYGRAPDPSLGIKLTGKADRVVEYDEVKRLFGEANPYDGEKLQDDTEMRKALDRHANKIKARLKRAREDLMHPDANVIGMAGKLLFWTGRPVRDFKETQPDKPKEPETSAGIEEAREQGIEGLF